jgi:choline dehydrogenase
MLNACELAFSHSWERHDPDDHSQLRARILGGCSAHNACAVLPGAPSDYDEWGSGWTASELEPYLARAAETIRTRRFRGEERAPVSRAVLEGTRELGLPVLDDASEPRAGAGPFPVNALGGPALERGFRLPRPGPRTREPHHPRGCARRPHPARRRGRRLRGGEQVELDADRVVLAAGAYGSPAILLRSGIGPDEGLPVGENLVDPAGRVLGFDNLYVSDASVMPTIPRANTNLSTLAVAEKIAEGIARVDTFAAAV